MKSAWKKNKNLKPQVVLDKIQAVAAVLPDGRVSYTGFESFFVMSALTNMVLLPTELSEPTKEAIVRTAVKNGLLRNKLNSEWVSAEIIKLSSAELSKPLRNWKFLTTLSIRGFDRAKIYKVGNESIRVLPSGFPAKYSSREDELQRLLRGTDPTPKNYVHAIVDVKSKSGRDVEQKATEAIDLLRSVWNFFCNPGYSIGSNEHRPINAVLAGKYQSVHSQSGAYFNRGTYYFNPRFFLKKAFDSNTRPEFAANTDRWILRELFALPYGKTVRKALLQYCRAFDEADPHTTLVRLWSALETLALEKDESHALIPKRCAFIWQESEYHKQILEHLRVARNSNVHEGFESSDAKTHCFQLNTYFRELLLFHLHSRGSFASFSEINEFLSLPKDRESLTGRKAILDRALNFISPGDVPKT